jgi:alpha-L-rhamnosidase
VAKMATVLDKNAEATQYRQLADSVIAGFQKRFYHSDTHSFANGTQTANTLPLAFGMVKGDQQKDVFTSLREDIVYYKNTHLTTGILGAKHLLPVLTANSRSDLAYDLATQTTYPSWGYMIGQGATTIWELWQDVTGPSMNSHNHPMFGSVGAWFYTALAGINTDPQKPGYERIRIAPQMTRDLQYASGSLDTVRGRVASDWQRQPGETKLKVAVPVGSTAEVDFPVLGMIHIVVTEGGRPVWKEGAYVSGVPGITGAKLSGGKIEFEVQSGGYSFEAHEGDVE